MQAPADERMVAEQSRGRADGVYSIPRGIRVLAPQELECVLQVIERSRRIDYRRHGLGRAAPGLLASRSIQACTSSAR